MIYVKKEKKGLDFDDLRLMIKIIIDSLDWRKSNLMLRSACQMKCGLQKVVLHVFA